MKQTKHEHLSSNIEDTYTSCIPLNLAAPPSDPQQDLQREPLTLSYKMTQSKVARINLPQFPEQEAF